MFFLETWKSQGNTEHLGRGGGWTANWQRSSVAWALLQKSRQLLGKQVGPLESRSLSLVTPHQLPPRPHSSQNPLSSVCLPHQIICVLFLIGKGAMATWSRMPTEMTVLGYSFSYEGEKKPWYTLQGCAGEDLGLPTALPLTEGLLVD